MEVCYRCGGFSQRNAEMCLRCPVCYKSWVKTGRGGMVKCHACCLWVHSLCDPNAQNVLANEGPAGGDSLAERGGEGGDRAAGGISITTAEGPGGSAEGPGGGSVVVNSQDPSAYTCSACVARLEEERVRRERQVRRRLERAEEERRRQLALAFAQVEQVSFSRAARVAHSLERLPCPRPYGS